MVMKKYSLALHGGAGTILKNQMNPDLEEQYKKALNEALKCGMDILDKGGSALHAVEEVVVTLEDCPLFNAGKGSVFTHEGHHEMDAAIMSGTDLNAGAVCLVRRIKNPVRLAKLVMDSSPHVLLAGSGAEAFARSHGMEWIDEKYFYTEQRFKQLQNALEENKISLDHDHSSERKFGTVGAVAFDTQGQLAAATSTGGMTNKRWGRIGDSPIPGAGTYANNESCAVSCTGTGELFMRSVAAFQVHALMKYAGLNLFEACFKVVHEILPSIEGDGGLIAIDNKGEICLDFNTEGMYRAFGNSDGSIGIEIYQR